MTNSHPVEFLYVFDNFLCTHPRLLVEELLSEVLQNHRDVPSPLPRLIPSISERDDADEVFDVGHPFIEAVWLHSHRRYVPVPRFPERQRPRAVSSLSVTELVAFSGPGDAPRQRMLVFEVESDPA